MGMDKYLKKKLMGNLYYLEPEFFSEILVNLGKNLVSQGFKKIFVVTGHGGTGQSKALSLAGKKLKNLVIINPYQILKGTEIKIEHADEGETSLFWACYPEEEKEKLAPENPGFGRLFPLLWLRPAKKGFARAREENFEGDG